jgi:hypothetical protein
VKVEVEEEEEEENYTPKSPHSNLQEHPMETFPSSPLPPPIHTHAAQSASASSRQPLKPRTRNTTTDQLGLRTFDLEMFEPNVAPQKEFNQAPRYLPQPPMQQRHQQQPHPYFDGYHSDQQNASVRSGISGGGSQFADDAENMHDPALAYIQSYLRSPRPNAPVPPTPHNQTAAPSPSPLVSDSGGGFMDLPVPVGSPYPYPFSHVRRTRNYANTPSQLLSHQQMSPASPMPVYDPNDPSVIQKQIALQLQMYALNNLGGHLSDDSTLSPSSTPFHQIPGYNPWAYLNTRRGMAMGGKASGGGSGNSMSMSLRSSPSHQPISLPPPPLPTKGD